MERKLKRNRKAVDGSCAPRKKSRVEEDKSVVVEINNLYWSGEFLERITECWRFVKKYSIIVCTCMLSTLLTSQVMLMCVPACCIETLQEGGNTE